MPRKSIKKLSSYQKRRLERDTCTSSLSTTQSKLRDSEQLVQTVIGQHDTCRSQLQTCETQRTSLTQRITTVEHELSQQQKRSGHYQDAILQLQNNIQSLSNQLAQKEREYNEQVNRATLLHTQSLQSAEERQRFVLEHTRDLATITQLRGELQRCREEMAQVQSTLSTLQAEHTNVRGENTLNTAFIQQLQVENNQLQTDLTAVREQMTLLSEQMARCNEQHTTHQRIIGELQTDKSSLQQRIQTVDSQMEQTNRQLGQLQTDYQALETRLSQETTLSKDLLRDIDTIRAETQTMVTQLQSEHASIQGLLQEQLGEIQGSHATIRSQLEEAELALANTSMRHTTAESQRTQLQANYDQQMVEMQQLRSELSTLQGRYTEQVRLYNDSESIVQRLTQQNEAYRVAKIDADQTITQKENEIVRYVEQLHALHEEIAQLEQGREDQEAETTEIKRRLQEQIAQHLEERNEKERQYDETKQLLDTCTTTVADCKERLGQVQSKMEELTRNYTAQRNELEKQVTNEIEKNRENEEQKRQREEDYNYEINTLRDELASIQQELSQAQEMIRRQQHTLETNETDMNTLESSIDGLQATIAERQEEINRLVNEITSVRQGLDQCQSEKSIITEQNRTCQESDARKSDVINTIQGQLRAVATARNQLSEENIAQQKQITTLEKERVQQDKNHTLQLQNEQSKIDRITREKQVVQEEADTCNRSKRQLLVDIEQKQKKQDENQAQLASLRDELQQVQLQQQRVTQKHVTEKSELSSQLQTNTVTNQQEIGRLQEEVERCETSKRGLVAEIARREADTIAYQSEMASLRSNLATIQSTLTRSESERDTCLFQQKLKEDELKECKYNLDTTTTLLTANGSALQLSKQQYEADKQALRAQHAGAINALKLSHQDEVDRLTREKDAQIEELLRQVQDCESRFQQRDAEHTQFESDIIRMSFLFTSLHDHIQNGTMNENEYITVLQQSIPTLKEIRYQTIVQQLIEYMLYLTQVPMILVNERFIPLTEYKGELPLNWPPTDVTSFAVYKVPHRLLPAPVENTCRYISCYKSRYDILDIATNGEFILVETVKGKPSANTCQFFCKMKNKIYYYQLTINNNNTTTLDYYGTVDVDRMTTISSITIKGTSWINILSYIATDMQRMLLV